MHLVLHAAPLTIAVMPGILMVVKNVFTMAPNVEAKGQLQPKTQQQEAAGLLSFSWTRRCQLHRCLHDSLITKARVGHRNLGFRGGSNVRLSGILVDKAIVLPTNILPTFSTCRGSSLLPWKKTRSA